MSSEQLFVLLIVMMGVSIPLLVIALPAIIILGLVKIVRGSSSKKSKELEVQETRLIQEIHQGLAQMEKRVEALETILLDSRREGDKV